MKSVKLRLVVLMGIAAALAVGCSSQSKRKPSNSDQFTIIRSDYTPSELDDLCDEAIEKFENDLKTAQNAYDLDWAITDFSDATDSYSFMKYVSTDEDLREEAGECEEAQSKIMVEVFTRRDLYNKVKNTELKREQDRYFVDEMIKEFEANGMALNDDSLKKFKSLMKELKEIETKFSKNLLEDKTRVYFTEAEAAGVPASFLETKEKKDGKYEFTVKYTDYNAVMNNATNPETRRRMLAAYENRAGNENSKLMKEAVALRHQIATLLGFKHWADYRTASKMAGSADKALNLLNDLSQKLEPRLKRDLKRLQEAKDQMEGKEAGPLTAWDLRFYINQVKKQDYNLDDEELRKYFPKDYTMAGMFSIYETLFGVKFEEVKDAHVWHPDVKLYKTIDKKSRNVVSYFYMDLFPRDGKYGHAAAFTLIRGRRLADGSYSKPVSSVVANFTAPTSDKPSLLTFNEVETLFHEFGHIVHQTLTRAPYGTASGTAVKRDFVEAPSQMLENWIWNKRMLKRFSKHYKTGEGLPRKLADKLIASRDYNQGYHYARQITFGRTDMHLHTNASVDDVNEIFRKYHQETIGVPAMENTKWMAGFGHLMGGYDAGYYGYIWSEVYAADMFTRFKRRGYLSSNTGKRYRDHILEMGGMEDPFTLISRFLGRQPNNRAFLRKLGL